MSKSALASLTAQYTDSENEGDVSPDSENSQASQVIIPKRITPVPSPAKHELSITSSNKTNLKKKKKRSKKVQRLVSYQDDTLISDEDDNQMQSSESSDDDSETDTEEGATSNINDSSGNKVDNPGSSMDIDDDSVVFSTEISSAEILEKSSKYAHYNFNLPPEPKGKSLPELVEKINHLYSKMEQTNMDMNRVIQDRKEFRNPSIYEKLIQFCDINEFGTNYPPEIYDPLQWGPESYYEELARVQKNEMLKRQKERKDLDKIEQATVLARKVEEEAKKRKSKWDQPAAATKPSVPQALTTTVTGTKGTVISAFGSLPKKPTL